MLYSEWKNLAVCIAIPTGFCTQFIRHFSLSKPSDGDVREHRGCLEMEIYLILDGFPVRFREWRSTCLTPMNGCDWKNSGGSRWRANWRNQNSRIIVRLQEIPIKILQRRKRMPFKFAGKGNEYKFTHLRRKFLRTWKVASGNTVEQRGTVVSEDIRFPTIFCLRCFIWLSSTIKENT